MTPTPVAPVPGHLEQAGQALFQVLVRLNQYAKNRVNRLDPSAPYAASTMSHVRDLDALVVAVQRYERAVMACLPATPVPAQTPDLSQFTPEEILAMRQADRVYQLGYARGHKAGVEKEQHKHDPALRLYAQHAQLPAPHPVLTSDYEGLVTRVRRIIATMTERYGAGPIPYHP